VKPLKEIARKLFNPGNGLSERMKRATARVNEAERKAMSAFVEMQEHRMAVDPRPNARRIILSIPAPESVPRR